MKKGPTTSTGCRPCRRPRKTTRAGGEPQPSSMTPIPKVAPRELATASCEHMSSSLISLCRSCTQNASGSHLHLLRVGTQSRLAPKRRHRTDEKMEKKRPTTPSCRRPFGETPENNKRRRYAGRRTVFPSVRTDPPESTPLTPLCDGCCFPLDSLCTRGPTNAIHSHFEM